MDFIYQLSSNEVAILEWIVDEQNSVLREGYDRAEADYNAAIVQFNQTVLAHSKDEDFILPPTPEAPTTPAYKDVTSVMQELTKDMLGRFVADKRSQRLQKLNVKLQNADPAEQEVILSKVGV